jgi:hypothetical protein
MIRDVTNVWKKTVDAHWGDAKSVCVEGSYGDKSALPGGSGTQASTDGKKKSAAARANGSGALMGLAVGLVGAVWLL